jgi:hypothetical protein
MATGETPPTSPPAGAVIGALGEWAPCAALPAISWKFSREVAHVGKRL